MEIVGKAGLFAAVERLPAPPALSEPTLRRQHRRVVALANEVRAILPVRFGAWIEASELERVLRVRQRVLRLALKAVRGREQMTVRVLGSAEPPSPQGHRDSGTDYLLARARSSRPILSPTAKAIQRAVGPLVAAERIDGSPIGIMVTLNHLVRRNTAQRYRTLVQSVVDQHELQSSVIVSGPWPPFAFAPDLWLAESQEALVRS